jgi:cardiolipin synthase
VGEFHNWFADFVRPVAGAFSVWGGVLFVWSGLLYTVQTRAALRARSTMSPGTGAAEGLS